MSIRSQTQVARGHSTNSDIYKYSFIKDVHKILSMGVKRLQLSALRGKEETAITGWLVKSMRGVLEDPLAPAHWANHYVILEDPPSDDSDEEGKKRPRVDIEFQRTQVGERPRFQFEAKRLRKEDSNSVSKYLGEDGLGCFISGKYSRKHNDAGMLGYVESETVSHWSSQVRIALGQESSTYKPPMGDYWTQKDIESDLKYCYLSTHDRPSVGRPINIYHTFLSLI